MDFPDITLLLITNLIPCCSENINYLKFIETYIVAQKIYLHKYSIFTWKEFLLFYGGMSYKCQLCQLVYVVAQIFSIPIDFLSTCCINYWEKFCICLFYFSVLSGFASYILQFCYVQKCLDFYILMH